MPQQPTSASVHINRPLTNLSIAYTPTVPSISDKVFPIVPSQEQSNRYFLYKKEFWHRSEAQVRAPGAPSAGGGFEIDNTPNFFCDVVALHKDVDDQIRANTDSPLSADRDATKYVTRQLVLKREIDWASAYFGTGIWTGSTTGTDIGIGSGITTAWSTAGSIPIEDIDEQIEAITLTSGGYRPNKLILGAQVWRVLKNHAEILDRYKHTQAGVITEELVARAIGVDEVLVARMPQNTAAEGATVAMSFIADPQDALLVYAAPNPSLMEVSGGYTFTWTGLLGAGPQGQRVKRFRMEDLASDRIEAEMSYDMKIVAPDVGCYFNEVVA